jgi:hypothetical protein
MTDEREQSVERERFDEQHRREDEQRRDEKQRDPLSRRDRPLDEEEPDATEGKVGDAGGAPSSEAGSRAAS